MERWDAAVLGGGLLGCFTARALTRYRLSVVLLEAREDVCTGLSRANTAVVYTGCDTRPGTLKTQLCVAANRSFDALCQELGVAFRRCGSLMVSYGPGADRVLEKKYAQGLENGVEGLRLLPGGAAEALEPVLAPGSSSALYAPGTGTVNPWELGIAAYENAVANGCAARFNAEVTGVTPAEGGYVLHTPRGEIFARAVVNCCGLEAGRVQELAAPPSVRIVPDRADYLVLDEGAGSAVQRVIFHEPEGKGKGLTLVPTTDGKLLAGPSERPDEGEMWAAAAAGLDWLRAMAGRVAPGLDLGQTIHSFGAVRPNPYYVRREGGAWVTEARSISNFTIQESAPRFWSLIGIKTPGLTCAEGLGRYVAGQLCAALEVTGENPDFDPVRPAPVRVKDLSMTQYAALAAQRPAYGKLLCRCGRVSEGEVLDAIRRGAVTLDGVKRRTGAGLGRCQGAFCGPKVMKLLSRELGIPISELIKDAPGSWLAEERT